MFSLLWSVYTNTRITSTSQCIYFFFHNLKIWLFNLIITCIIRQQLKFRLPNFVCYHKKIRIIFKFLKQILITASGVLWQCRRSEFFGYHSNFLLTKPVPEEMIFLNKLFLFSGYLRRGDLGINPRPLFFFWCEEFNAF